MNRGPWVAVAALPVLLAGCSLTGDETPASTLHAPASAPAGLCPSGQAYAHATLGYHACFPNGWRQRDYTAEPGANGALSVVAFGPEATVPTHVPAATEFAVPIEVRVVGGAKAGFESSLTAGNQVDHVTVAGVTADRIRVTQDGPAQGAVIVVFEYQGDTFELEKGPGSSYQPEFETFLASFGF
ncbi:MAG TPA: hypothetical protein VEQ12_12185 [Candidatus Limnocylindria bacterium]|nr:hypothetical protein [Candidatus Limnocylindria bacterium]